MLEDICRQFTHLPSAEAAQLVAAHLTRYWAPVMRRDLIQQAQAQDLSDIARLAVLALVSPQT
jgi:NADH-dependant formate dehydrogenase delta subunit FdsD